MKISIITVAYNSENTINQTIQSILSQTYENIEYIVVNKKKLDPEIAVKNIWSGILTFFFIFSTYFAPPSIGFFLFSSNNVKAP